MEATPTYSAALSDAEQIVLWLENDPVRYEALQLASSLNLPDWCLAAGFVRNLAWDNAHGYVTATPLNDIDLIYFNPVKASKDIDLSVEAGLKRRSNLPWSVKNQARMHVRNEDRPYVSTSDAMSYWVEIETAVGARLCKAGGIELVAPFGVRSLFNKSITMNSKRPKPSDFARRMSEKNWLSQWPQLQVVEASQCLQ
mgnify:FL=1